MIRLPWRLIVVPGGPDRLRTARARWTENKGAGGPTQRYTARPRGFPIQQRQPNANSPRTRLVEL